MMGQSLNIKKIDKRKIKQKEDVNWPGIRLMEWCREFIVKQRKAEWLKFLQNRFNGL